MDTRVVIENALLRGSQNDSELQRVATVYLDTREYRVMAPSWATGAAVEWQDQFNFRAPSKDVRGTEEPVGLQTAAALVGAVVHELKQEQAEADFWEFGKRRSHPTVGSCNR